MEIEPTDSGACSIDRFWLDIQFNTLTFYPTTTMHSPAPNIPGTASAVSPFNKYMDELEATSIDDIRELDETTDALFAREDASIHTLGIGGGAASAGPMAAQPQGGNLAAARAMAAISCSMGGCTNFFVEDDIVKEMVDQLKSETANPLPVCPGYWQGGAQPQDTNQKPPADEGKHAPSKKPPCQSIISCDDTGLFLKKAAATKKEKKEPPYNTNNVPKVSLIVAFFLNMHCHHLNPCPTCALSKSLSNSPSTTAFF
jgi:hypothetical protein